MALNSYHKKKRKGVAATEPNADQWVSHVSASFGQDVVNRYGAGINEHYSAYDGRNSETGTRSKRSLESISKSKTAPKGSSDYNRNIAQQSGFSAEEKEVARRRAEEAISGKKPRTRRTDDCEGHVNDPYFDITSNVDANGNPDPNSSFQMKFVGKDPVDAVGKMLSSKYDKYLDNNVKIMVPKDYYDGMIQHLDERIAKIERELGSSAIRSSPDAVAKKQRLLEKCKKLKKSLRRSMVTRAEATEARLHPKWSTMKDVAQVTHRAGIEQMENGIVISLPIHALSNALAVVKGEKKMNEALADTAKGATISAARDYVVGASGSFLKGTLQHAPQKVLRAISKSAIPSQIVRCIADAVSPIVAFASGKISGKECTDRLVSQGILTAGSTAVGGVTHWIVGSALGTAWAPLFVGMLSFELFSKSYNIIRDSFINRDRAIEERNAAEALCDVYKRRAQEACDYIRNTFDAETRSMQRLFDEVFHRMDAMLDIGDINGYVANGNRIIRALGREPLFNTAEELNDRILSGKTIRFRSQLRF